MASLFLATLFILPKLPYIFRKDENQQPLNLVQQFIFLGLHDFIKFWHRYELHGHKKIQEMSKNGNVLVVGYHSRSTYDIFYLMSALRPNVIGSSLFFKVPIISYLSKNFNILPSKSSVKDDSNKTEDAFINAVANGDKPLLLLPGGMKEALKDYSERHEIHWKDIPGFVRLICNTPEKLGTNTKVVPFYTKNCEYMYFHTKWSFDYFGKLAFFYYNKFKKGGNNIILLPVVGSIIFVALGFLLLPTTAKLETYFGEPLQLQPNESAQSFTDRIKKACQDIIDKVQFDKDVNIKLLKDDDEIDNDDDTKRKKEEEHSSILTTIQYTIVGTYAFTQNIFFTCFLMSVTWLPFPFLVTYVIGKNIYDVIIPNSNRKDKGQKNKRKDE